MLVKMVLVLVVPSVSSIHVRHRNRVVAYDPVMVPNIVAPVVLHSSGEISVQRGTVPRLILHIVLLLVLILYLLAQLLGLLVTHERSELIHVGLRARLDVPCVCGGGYWQRSRGLIPARIRPSLEVGKILGVKGLSLARVLEGG